MKTSVMAMTAALTVVLCHGGTATAQYGTRDPGASTRNGTPVRASLQDGAESAAISVQPVAYDDESAGGVCAAASACDTNGSCGSCGSRLDSFLHPNCCKVADLGDPFKVADGCFFKENKIQVGGWLAQSYTWNPDSPKDKYNGPVTWTDRSNEYQLNELYVYLGRAADTKGCGWDYGYRVDAMYGSNYLPIQ